MNRPVRNSHVKLILQEESARWQERQSLQKCTQTCRNAAFGLRFINALLIKRTFFFNTGFLFDAPV